MTRREVIVALLERFDDLHDPRAGGNGGDQGLGGLMPHEPRCHMWDWSPPVCTCSYRAVVELECLLRRMRDDRSHPLLKLEGGRKVSLRACWWHLNARFIAAPSVIRAVEVPVLDKHGRRRRRKDGSLVTGLERRVVRVSGGADPVVVERGIEWLEGAWPAGVVLELPQDFVVAA